MIHKKNSNNVIKKIDLDIPDTEDIIYDSK
jgi:hypothetical protein